MLFLLVTSKKPGTIEVSTAPWHVAYIRSFLGVFLSYVPVEVVAARVLCVTPWIRTWDNLSCKVGGMGLCSPPPTGRGMGLCNRLLAGRGMGLYRPLGVTARVSSHCSALGRIVCLFDQTKGQVRQQRASKDIANRVWFEVLVRG